jgi:uncharacterized protein HemX
VIYIVKEYPLAIALVLALGIFIGVVVGFIIGIWLAHRAAATHVARVNDAVRRAEEVSGEASKTASQAHRVSLHVSDQYAPLRRRLEDVEREIASLQQQVHEIRVGLPEGEPG